jgi:hypothetical protein
LDRASVYETEGHAFESRQARFISALLPVRAVLATFAVRRRVRLCGRYPVFRRRMAAATGPLL